MAIEFLLGIVHVFGYLGVFFASLIGSATIFLPVPSFLLVFLAGKLLDPLWVGIIGGIGAAIGELTSYGIGFGIIYGKKKLEHKNKKKKPNKNGWNIRLKKWFNGRYGMLIIFIFAATPLPDDIVGLYCGAIKYDIKKFFIATLIGKILLCIAIAYAGFYGLGVATQYFL